MCVTKTTWSHRPLTDLGELGSQSQFHSLPSQLSPQVQSPPFSFFHSPAFSWRVRPQVVPKPAFGPLLFPRLPMVKILNFSRDLRGRGYDPHRVFCLLGFPSDTPAPFITPRPTPSYDPSTCRLCLTVTETHAWKAPRKKEMCMFYSDST